MAQFPIKTDVKTELQESTSSPALSCDHLTTTNFGDINVAYYRHNTPREHWECDASVFAWPMPMQTPILAKAQHNLKCFYVPFRVLSPQFNAFINKSPHMPMNGNTTIQVTEMPFIAAGTFADFVIDNEVSTIVTSSGDFKVGTDWYKLTNFGRYAVKILYQLGYTIFTDNKATTHIDAMALLAYAKVFMDFYYNSAYMSATTPYLDVEKLLKKDGTAPYQLNVTDMKNIFKLCQKAYYTQDYFTACWDNPSAPNSVSTTMGNITLTDITTPSPFNEVSTNGSNGTPQIQKQGGGNLTFITQYAIDSLKKMSDYCARFAMAGVREVDRYLARFGVLLTAEKLKRSVFYGEQITPMEMGSVYATANGGGARIGDYAGKGIINSDNKEHKHFEIDSEEYGIILILGTIIPKIGYYQGIDRNNLHHEVETYFSGVFDQLGTQAVSCAELFVSPEVSTRSGDAQINAIFGYLPRGAEYKTARDKLTGDFRYKSLNTYAGSWHLFRTFDDAWFTTNGISHSNYFTSMWDSGQYLRIFNATTEEEDHFNVLYQFAIDARIHAKPLYKSYDFESEGKEILMNTNGPKQN